VLTRAVGLRGARRDACQVAGHAHAPVSGGSCPGRSVRSVTNWEYLRLSTEIGTDDPELPASVDDWLMRIVSLGVQGWEAVGPVVLHDQPGEVRFLLMKRASKT